MDGNKQTAYFHQHPNKEITDHLVSMDPSGAGQSWSEWSKSMTEKTSSGRLCVGRL
jgi:hypothetical protein